MNIYSQISGPEDTASELWAVQAPYQNNQAPPMPAFDPIKEKLQSQKVSDQIINQHYRVNLAYRLAKGEKYVFRMVSSDSIVVFGDPTLFRQRIEQYTITVDSVDGHHKYYLTQELTDYISMESQGYILDVKRTSHPWLNRKIHFKIDSMGNRYEFPHYGSIDAQQSPGGAFQPYIIPALEYGNRYLGEKWTFKREITVPENGFPYPRWEETTLLALMPPKDTLGMVMNQVELNRSSVGFLDIALDTNKVMQVVNSMNSYGYFYISDAIGLPTLQIVTAENKMKIYGFSEKPRETHHFIDSKIILESCVDPSGRETYSYTP